MKKCVICGQEFEKSEYYPFCSMRCKNVDLNRWFSEVYFIPEEPKEELIDSVIPTNEEENSDGKDSI